MAETYVDAPHGTPSVAADNGQRSLHEGRKLTIIYWLRIRLEMDPRSWTAR
jgi:hypothetical protein